MPPITRAQAEQRRAALAHQVWSIGHIREDIIRYYSNSLPLKTRKKDLCKLLTIDFVAFRDVVKIVYGCIRYCQFPWHCNVPESRMLVYRHAVTFLDIQGALPACISSNDLFDYFPRLKHIGSLIVDMSRPALNDDGNMETLLTVRQTLQIGDDLELSEPDFIDHFPPEWDVLYTWDLYIQTSSPERVAEWTESMELARNDGDFELPDALAVGDICDLAIDWCGDTLPTWTWLLAQRKRIGYPPIDNLSFFHSSVDNGQLEELADIVGDTVETLRIGMDYDDFLSAFPTFEWSRFTQLDYLTVTVYCYPGNKFDPTPYIGRPDPSRRSPNLLNLEIEIFVFNPDAEDRSIWDIAEDDNWLELMAPNPKPIGRALAAVGAECNVSITLDISSNHTDMLDQFGPSYLPRVEKARLAALN